MEEEFIKRFGSGRILIAADRLTARVRVGDDVVFWDGRNRVGGTVSRIDFIKNECQIFGCRKVDF